MSRTKRRDPYKLAQGKTQRDGRITMAHTPQWFISEFMNRPKRRLNRKLCKLVLAGQDEANLPWPTGNRKPQEYYW